MVGDGCAGPPKPSICSDQEQAFGGVRLTGGFLGPLAGMLGTDSRTAYPITKYALSRWSAHGAITAPLAAVGNATRI
jgi:hypothetical protein